MEASSHGAVGRARVEGSPRRGSAPRARGMMDGRDARPRPRRPRLHHPGVGHLVRDREGGARPHPRAAAAGRALLAGGGLLRLGALRPPRGRPRALARAASASPASPPRRSGSSLTSASNAAFITGLAVVLTPMLAAVVWRRRVAPRVYGAAAVAVAGLALLTIGEGGVAGLNAGDVWVLGTALTYAGLRRLPGRGRRARLGVRARRHAAPADGAARLGVGLAGARRPRRRAAFTFGAIAYLAVVSTALVAVLQTMAQRVVAAPAGRAGVRARARLRRRLRRLVARASGSRRRLAGRRPGRRGDAGERAGTPSRTSSVVG
jgi:drug/metabolite transporter (DMT)-like permease